MQLGVSLQLLFVLHCLPVSASVSSLITQSEDVTVTEGDTVNISCCWEHLDERARVTWKKNKTNIQNYLLDATSNVQLKCSFLTIANITMEHTGTYICTVSMEIPILKQVSGNGTTIRVLAREKTEETKENGDSSDHEDSNGSHLLDVLGQGLRCLPLVTLLLVFVCLNKSLVKKRRQEPSPSPQKGHDDIELQSLQ